MSATAAKQCFDIPADRFDDAEAHLRAAAIQNSIEVVSSFPFTKARIPAPLRKNSARRTSSNGLVSVLHDVELVDDPAVRSVLLDAQPVRFPHVHANCCNPHPLSTAQLAIKELVERFFPPGQTIPAHRYPDC